MLVLRGYTVQDLDPIPMQFLFLVGNELCIGIVCVVGMLFGTYLRTWSLGPSYETTGNKEIYIQSPFNGMYCDQTLVFLLRL